MAASLLTFLLFYEIRFDQADAERICCVCKLVFDFHFRQAGQTRFCKPEEEVAGV